MRFTIGIYLDYFDPYACKRHERERERKSERADLGVEISCADSSACITHPPMDGAALLERTS